MRKVLAFCTLLLAAPAAHAQHIEAELERLAAIAGGTVGVGALHLETGRSFFLNPDERFPMASSYKVPIAIQLLTRVDRGEKSLDTMIDVRPVDVHPGSGTLAELFQVPGVALSLRNLMELMLLISDNSATDMVLREAGGAAAVTARVRGLGITDLRVDRPTSLLIGDWLGIEDLPADGNVSLEEFRKKSAALTDEQRRAAAQAFDADPRDTSSPLAMTELIAQVWRGNGLTQESRDLLFDIMLRSTTGAGRIRGMLPPGIAVAHKTGTIGGTTNDVGVMTLPDDRGHVVTVVFVKESTLPVETRERAIAQISRAIYDWFLFRPAS